MVQIYATLASMTQQCLGIIILMPLGEPVPSGTTVASLVSYFDRLDNLPIVAAMTISGSGVSSEPVSDGQTIYITGVGIDGLDSNQNKSIYEAPAGLILLPKSIIN